MLILDEQFVRRYWCMFECIIAWYRMQHGTIAIAHSTPMQTHYNGNGTRYALMLIEYMERYRVGFERTDRTLVLVHI